MRGRENGRSPASPLAVLSALGILAGTLAAQERLAAPPDAVSIERRLGRLIEALDAPGYGQAVAWDEHVVLCYTLAHGRDPAPEELFLLRGYRQDLGISHSSALLLVLREGTDELTWAQCREFSERVEPSDFRVDLDVSRRTRRIAAVPPSRIALTLTNRQPPGAPPVAQPLHTRPFEPYPEPYVRYNTYFGYLHAHCELSDGEGTALEAYTHARDQGGLDFFALTDHGELLSVLPGGSGWQELKDAAQATNSPGSFVTLWGFEWSSPLFGHMNILNTQDFTTSLAEFSMADVYDWIVARPAAIGRYNHPGREDTFGTEFTHLSPYPAVREQMVGIATWNKNDGFDLFYYAGGWSSSQSYWDEGNGQGWYLGSLGGQDNHSPDWGTRNDFRTAVLATELTREGILDGYRNRRFYATEDANLHLELRCSGHPMGTRLSGGHPRAFNVQAWDTGGDTFEEVRLYRDGDLLYTRSVSGLLVSEWFDDSSATGAHYYYVIVKQTDDSDGNGRNDEAISSPIWIGP